MKRLAITAVAAAALATPAFSADLSRPALKAASYAAPSASWTGFYIQGGFGYGIADIDHSVSNAAATATFDIGHGDAAKGFLGTVGAGLDFQVAPTWVIGAFADGDLSNIKGQYSFNCPVGCRGPNGFVGVYKQNWAWGAGGRVGYLALPSLLTYVNGGFTEAQFGGVKYTDVSGNFPTPGLVTTGESRSTGYFIGGGTEYAISALPSLFWKNEYRFADYGHKDLPQICSAFGCGVLGSTHSLDHSRTSVQTIRTELVYRFNSGGAAVSADASRPAVKAAPDAPASWTGFYVQGGFGYGIADLDHSVSNAAGTSLIDIGHTNAAKGFLGTAGAGFDFQVAPTWVIGAFADADFTGMKGKYTFSCDFPCLGPTGFAGSSKEDWAWAVGARVGYVALPSLLTYANGGFTQAQFGAVNYADASGIQPLTPGVSLGERRYSGYFFGGGTEYAMSVLPGLFWKNEYRFADYGNKDGLQTCTVVTGCSFPGGPTHSIDRSQASVQTIRTELVYRFNWGSPLRAKY
jgi:opacity protein-like surface antigen